MCRFLEYKYWLTKQDPLYQGLRISPYVRSDLLSDVIVFTNRNISAVTASKDYFCILRENDCTCEMEGLRSVGVQLSVLSVGGWRGKVLLGVSKTQGFGKQILKMNTTQKWG